ncbi:hypothetical protein JDT40_00115 [Escherichia coli]|nr:hypothetical protein [Escherichia coli]MDN0395731.1 hypothetical protein [Escherichia coli]MDN1029730.1 hypothetical protein [Escherichia coli]MDN2035867.1 hypothetical protein [Escherichia coli]HAJ5267870.1 hypothetical protein [Escherichia coli]
MIKSNYICFLLLFFIGLTILHLNQYTLVSDDIWFSEKSISEPDHIKWLIDRYFTWSSRTWIEYALINLINHFYAWSLINAAMFSSLIIGICSIFQRENNLYYKINTSIMSLLLIVMMPNDVFFNAAIWITGSFNYLWPSAIAFIGYSLLIRKINMENHEKTQSLICYLLFFLSSFNEQIAVVNVLLCTTLLIFCKTNNYNTKPLLNAMGISLLVIIYIATCPGNKVRYYAEIEHWFKEYGNFNIIQRSMLGLNLYADMLFSVKSIIPALLAFSSTIICKKKTKIFPLISCCILITLYIIHTPPVIFQAIHFSESNLFSTLSVFRVSFAMILTALIIFPTVISLNFNVTSIFISTMIIGTIATTSMLGLSPSIYASGNRIYFIPYLLLITAIVVSTPIAINNIVANFAKSHYKI